MTGRNSAEVDTLRREVAELRRLVARGANIRGASEVGIQPGRVAGTTIPSDTLTELAEIKAQKDPDAWTAGAAYVPNVPVRHGGANYVCIKSHTSVAGAPGDEPGVGANWPTYWRLAKTAYEVYVLEPQVGTQMDTIWPVWIDDTLTGTVPDGFKGMMTMSRWGNWYMVPSVGMLTSGVTAYLNHNQVVGSGPWTQVLLDAETFDLGADFDIGAGHDFTAPQTGYYYAHGSLQYDAGGAAGAEAYAGIFVNGVVIASFANEFSGVQRGTGTGKLLYLVAGDSVELWTSQNSGGNATVAGRQNTTFLSIYPVGA